MDIDIKNYPIGIFFSGNIFDFRALQFFTVLNKQRITQLFTSSITPQIKLDSNEKSLLCIEKNGKFYLKYSFLKFIVDSGDYLREFNNINDTSDPAIKEIYFYMKKYSDPEEMSKYLNILLDIALKINYDDRNYINNIKLDFDIINDIFWSLDITDLNGFENENNLLIDFNFGDIFGSFHFSKPSIDYNVLIEGLYAGQLDNINFYKLKSNLNDGTESDLFKINFSEKFRIKDKKVNLFSGNFDLIGNIFKINNLILDRYNEYNLINFGDNHNYNEFQNLYIEKDQFFYNHIFTRAGIKGFKSGRQIDSLVKITKNKDIYTIEVDLFEEIRLVETAINIIQNYNTNNEALEIVKDNIKLLKSKVQGVLKIIWNYEKDLDNIINYMESQNKLDEATNEVLNEIKNNFITNMDTFKQYDRIIINFEGKSYNSQDISIVDNKISFLSDDLSDDILDMNIIITLNFIKIDGDKCFNLGLNLQKEDCSNILNDIILEKGYGRYTQSFFRNDINFKIYNLINFCAYEFRPDPNLILLLLNKLQFKKKIIKIYNTKFVIIQNYNSWIYNQKVDENLKNNKYLGKYLELCVTYINLNLHILNPKYKNFEKAVLIISTKFIPFNEEFKRKEPRFKYNLEEVTKRFFKKYYMKCNIDESKKFVNLLGGGLPKEDYEQIFLKKLLLKTKKIIMDRTKMELLYKKFDKINKLKILNNS